MELVVGIGRWGVGLPVPVGKQVYFWRIRVSKPNALIEQTTRNRERDRERQGDREVC